MRVDWVCLAQRRDTWQDVLDTVTNFFGSIKFGEFFYLPWIY